MKKRRTEHVVLDVVSWICVAIVIVPLAVVGSMVLVYLISLLAL